MRTPNWSHSFCLIQSSCVVSRQARIAAPFQHTMSGSISWTDRITVNIKPKLHSSGFIVFTVASLFKKKSENLTSHSSNYNLINLIATDEYIHRSTKPWHHKTITALHFMTLDEIFYFLYWHIICIDYRGTLLTLGFNFQRTCWTTQGNCLNN